MFFVSLIFVPLQFLISYTYDNIIESKALVPYFITERDAIETEILLEGRFKFWVKFHNYGGDCVTANQECISDI